jgi:hypothetical protein
VAAARAPSLPLTTFCHHRLLDTLQDAASASASHRKSAAAAAKGPPLKDSNTVLDAAAGKEASASGLVLGASSAPRQTGSVPAIAGVVVLDSEHMPSLHLWLRFDCAVEDLFLSQSLSINGRHHVAFKRLCSNS